MLRETWRASHRPVLYGDRVLETASWGRRILALLIDWIASILVLVAVAGPSAYGEGTATWFILGIFWLQSSIGVALAGGSFGHLVLGIRVLDQSGRPVTLLRAMLRQALVCLVIPPLVFQPDGRGLHDLWTKSAAWRVSR